MKITMELSLKDINSRIDSEIFKDVIDKLSDLNLNESYKNTKSVKKSINTLSKILDTNLVESDKKEKILSDYSIYLVPPGTKGVIRGNKFNEFVKEFIQNLKLCSKKFEISFEKHCDVCHSSEKPDWYIREIKTNRVIIGMNQLDLWNGGQQLNRGSKYILNTNLPNNNKLLCVICNHCKIKTKNKVYNIFNNGFKNQTLCYLGGLKQIIFSYFNI